jgi:hypothetical protein
LLDSLTQTVGNVTFLEQVPPRGSDAEITFTFLSFAPAIAVLKNEHSSQQQHGWCRYVEGSEISVYLEKGERGGRCGKISINCFFC